MIVSITYALEDLPYYADTTKINTWNTNGVIRYSSYAVPNNSEVIFKFGNNFSKVRCGLGNGSGAYVTVWYKNPSSYQGHNYTYMYNTNPQTLHETITNITADDEISVKIQDGVATWYKNGVQQDSHSIPSNTMNIRFVDYSQYTQTYVKVKPL